MRTLAVVTYVVLVLSLVLFALGTDPVTQAVCGSDADCARWEVINGVPDAERCYGAPCPGGDRR